MLLPDYVSRNLTPPIPTKDGGTLRTIGEACEYMAAIGKEREQRRHWQQVRELMLQEADVAAVSWRVRLAVLKDAKVDVTALSEPMERWMDEPSSGFLSNGKLNVVEKDEPSTEPTERNERSDSESEEELRRSNHSLASWALLLRLPSRHQEIKFELPQHVGSRLGCATAPLEYRQPSPRSVLREPVMRTPSIRKYSSVLPPEVLVPRPCNHGRDRVGGVFD